MWIKQNQKIKYRAAFFSPCKKCDDGKDSRDCACAKEKFRLNVTFKQYEDAIVDMMLDLEQNQLGSCLVEQDAEEIKETKKIKGELKYFVPPWKNDVFWTK